MNPLLRDFYGHQVWADAEQWHCIEAQPSAAGDVAIKNRLHHIHMVQRVFLWAVSDRTAALEVTKPDDFASLADLKRYARDYHDMPWFTNPPLSITVIEALTQCAMHSHYHRGQNATRLRELGADPPGTDLIVWYWKGRPAPTWT